MVIVGIQNLNDIACKVFLFYGFLIISLVKGIQAEALYRLASQILRVLTMPLP